MTRQFSRSRVVFACLGALGAVACASRAVILEEQGASGAVWYDEGPETWAPRLTAAKITANDLRTRLYAFADDSMRGRKIGEPGNLKGTDYIAGEFARMGLKPAGDGGSWFQILAYGPGGYDSTSAALDGGGETLVPRRDWMPATPTDANGFGFRTSVSGAEAVFAGRYGDTAIVLDPAVFRGKIAVFLPAPTPPRAATPVLRCDSVPNKFGAAAAAAVEATPAGRRATAAPTVRDFRAQRAGAVAILIASLRGGADTSARGAFASRMMMRPTPAAEGVGGANITSDAGARLFGRPLPEVAVGTVGKRMSARWRFDWTLSSSPARNVIAVLPGSDPARAAEYVLVGAHNDHIGMFSAGVDHDSIRAVNTVTRVQGQNDPVCRPTAEQQHRIDSLIARARSIRPARRDTVFNGADDDGSGTVVMLEIAERFAKEHPARSIVFMSHEGEEAGLLGSKWFVDHPTIPLTSIVAVHNMDMVGKGRAEQVMFGGPSSLQLFGPRRMSRDFGDIIDSVSAASPHPMALDYSWEIPANPLNRFCRSDQVNYVNKDIPTTYFSLGYAQDYHQVTDEPRYIDYDHSARVGNFIHDVMSAIANRRDRLRITGPDRTMPVCAR